MSRALFALLFVAVFTVPALCSQCTSPKAEVVSSFSTQDSTILTQLAHVGEFTVKCGNGAKPNLFAEFPCGRVVPVARIGEDKYQISWTEEIKKSSSGNVVVRLFDEEGYANIRKAQRDGDKVSGVRSLVDITIPTKSAYKGPWVKAELVAAVAVTVIGYFALSTKSKIQG